jgi:alkylation response protein AidB-like acyl-CoA dehydrogenase
VLVVYAKEAGGTSLSAFMVRRDDPGVEFSNSLGIKGCATATIGDVVLSGCEIPAVRLLGKPGAGAIMIQLALEHERAFIFAGMTGVMQWQLQRVIKYARTRPAGNGTLAGVQAVSHRIAAMQLRLETTRLWIRECAQLLDDGRRITLASAQAKLYASEAFLQSSLDAAHLLGASGLEGELPGLVHDAMPDACCRAALKFRRILLPPCSDWVRIERNFYSSRKPSDGSIRAERSPARPAAMTAAPQVTARAIA